MSLIYCTIFVEGEIRGRERQGSLIAKGSICKIINDSAEIAFDGETNKDLEGNFQF